MLELPRGTVTFLFTDIEGSTRLWESFPEQMKLALARHDTLLRTCIEQNDGAVVKTTGDGCLAVFARAQDGVASALAAQRVLAEEPWDPTIGQLLVRMALHTGTAEEREDDYYGPAVNRAARLMSAGHGGQVLLSQITRGLVIEQLPERVSTIDLGKHRLRDLSRPEYIFQLVTADLPSAFPPLRSLNIAQTNLPVQTTPFVGRQAKLAELAKLLADPEIRLITILGPGGIGKTRLSVAAAFAHTSAFADGVKFVPLAPLSETGDIISAMAMVLGLQFFEGSNTKQQLLGYLREKQMLLVLDNFEHLINGVDLVHELLLSSPGVKVLVTSREKLNLQEEVRFQPGGMSFPRLLGSESSARSIDVSLYGALALFLQNAQRARPGYELNEEELAHVIHICQLVGGNPLGILLAAAWVEMFSTREIATEISRSLDFLEMEMRDLPKRHRGMRAVFDSSWKQLSKAERCVFASLAVFRGGFKQSAAEAVARAGLQSLITLVNKSLLLRNRANGRYEIHELLRQYAGEQLEAAGQMIATRDKHCIYYAEFMGHRLDDILGKRQIAARDEIAADFENVRTAWNWAVRKRDYVTVERMAKSIYVYCDIQSRNHDGEELFRQAREMLEPLAAEEPHPTWSRILLAWYDMRNDSLGPVDDLDEITTQAELSLAIAEKQDDRVTIGYCLLLLGKLAADEREHSRAIHLYQQCLQYCPELEDGYYPFARMGHSYIALRQLQAAQSCFQRLLDRAREIGECTAVAWALSQIGEVELMRGDLVSPVQRWQEAAESFKRFGATYGFVYSTSLLSLAALIEGDLRQARSLAEEVELLGREHNFLSELYREALTVLGWLDILDEHYGSARQGLEELMTRNPTKAEAILGLSYAAIGLQMTQEARRYMQSVLSPGVKNRAPAFVVLQLAAAGLIFFQEGQKERAAEMLALTLTHPASPVKLLQRWPLIVDFQAILEDRLGQAYLADAKIRSEELDLPKIIPWLREQFLVSESVPEINIGTKIRAYQPETALVVPLSKREMEVLQLLKTDFSSPEIARELVVSLNTVRFHTKNIYSKLQVNNRIAAIQRAEDLGL